MSGSTVECAEIRQAFVNGSVPSGPKVEAHLRVCAPCRPLFEREAVLGVRLAESALAPPGADGLFALVENELAQERGVRARLRAWPRRAHVAVLVGTALGLAGTQLVWSRRSDFSSYSEAWFWGLALLLLAGLAVGAAKLARGVNAPLLSLARERGLLLTLLALPAVVALLAPTEVWFLRSAAPGWASPDACFRYGIALTVPFLLAGWLFERREVMPARVLVLSGALAGLSANLILHAHCPSNHLGHLLLGHASIGAAWALALGLLAPRFLRAS